jgi:hypothetical protein
MQPSSASHSALTSDRSSSGRGDVRQGVFTGLMPLVRLIVLFTFALTLTLGVRIVTSAQGFAMQQEAAVIALAAGLALAAIVYAVSIRAVYRAISAWRQAGHDVSAMAALWTLAATSLVVVLPVVVAAFLPQHPAP